MDYSLTPKAKVKWSSVYSKPLMKEEDQTTSIKTEDTYVRKLRKEVHPEKYNGKHFKTWQSFIAHFEACKIHNNWSDPEACSWLAASLTGDTVLALGPNWAPDQHSYSELKKRLERCLGPCHSEENYIIEFRNRKRQPGESLPELGQAMRRLVMRAYPDMSLDSQEQLVKEQFKDAVDDGDLRAAIFRAKAKTLDQAVTAAVETECFLKAEKSRGRGKAGFVRMTETGVPEATNERLEKVEAQMESMLQLLQGMQTLVSKQGVPNQKGKGRPTCFYCNDPGHFKMDCAKFKEDNPEGYHQYCEKQSSGNGPRSSQGPRGRPKKE
jgi:hypothetical protein